MEKALIPSTVLVAVAFVAIVIVVVVVVDVVLPGDVVPVFSSFFAVCFHPAASAEYVSNGEKEQPFARQVASAFLEMQASFLCHDVRRVCVYCCPGWEAVPHVCSWGKLGKIEF